MKTSRVTMEFIVVFVTCKSAKEAQRIAARLVQKRLAACVNIIGSVKSIYRWKGRIEAAKEILMVIKSTKRKFASLENEIRRLHSYDTPEIIALPVVAGSKRYLEWLRDCMEN